MTDHDTPRDGERLSAYLAGELGDTEVAELEAQLAADPDLAAELEALRALVETLGRLDEVEPPPGFADRLEARLTRERAADDAAAAVHETTPISAAPASLSDARAHRDERRRRRWPALGAVAAGVAGAALIGAVAIGGFGASEDAFDVAEAPEEDAAMEAMEAPDADDAPAAAEPDTLRRLGEPVVRDTEVMLDDAEEVRARLAGGPADDLLGMPVDEADDLAAAFAVAVRRADDFAEGTAPGACLDVVTAGAEQPVVVAQVESARHDGSPALAYVTVTASADRSTLDRVEAWVLGVDGCATRLFVDLTPSG